MVERWETDFETGIDGRGGSLMIESCTGLAWIDDVRFKISEKGRYPFWKWQSAGNSGHLSGASFYVAQTDVHCAEYVQFANG
jgi:hypothetical protein